MKNNILISVVTISYNIREEIKNTILSVINQTYTNIEYIIIDGGSTDGTIDIIKKYSNKISYWISEPDYGIYNAMNKGIKIANGEWIIFMNAGDSFYNNTVIESILPYLDTKNHIVYGDALINASFGKYIQKATLPLNLLKKKMIFCHQSTFIKTEYHKKHLFDESYRSSGDYHFFYEAYTKYNCVFAYAPITIAIFDAISGISSTNFIRPKKEDLRIKGLDRNPIAILQMYINVSISIIKHKIKMIMPQRIASLITKQMIKKKGITILED